MCERYVPNSTNVDMLLFLLLESGLTCGLTWKKSNFDILEDDLKAEPLTPEVTAMKQRLICYYLLTALRGMRMSVYRDIYSLMADSHFRSDAHELCYLYKKNLLYEIAKNASQLICAVNFK